MDTSFAMQVPMRVHSFTEEPLKPSPPLSAYRFPNLRVGPEDHNKISELTEEDVVMEAESKCNDILNTSNNPFETEKQLVLRSTLDAHPVSLPEDLVEHASERSAVQLTSKRRHVKSARPNRADKLPVTAQSILLMRRTSSCLQPSSPRSSNPSGEISATSMKKNGRYKHACKLCDQSFTRAHDLKRHSTIHEKCKCDICIFIHGRGALLISGRIYTVKGFPCPYCSKAFGRKDALTRHLAVRGTNHNDFTKKAKPKARAIPDGLPKPSKLPPIVEEDANAFNADVPDADLSKLEPPVFASLELSPMIPASEENGADDNDSMDGAVDMLDNVTEMSSRASSIHTSPLLMMDRATSPISTWEPFNIDRKSSLVQGLPSAHLHLDESDLLHPFMNPFTACCGL